MKLRTGFVSNSSTSSFVMIGFELPKDKIQLGNLKWMMLISIFGMNPDKVDQMDGDAISDALYDLRETGYCLLENSDDGLLGDSPPFFGKKVDQTDAEEGDRLNSVSINIDDLVKELELAQTKLALDGPIKLITGVACC